MEFPNTKLKPGEFEVMTVNPASVLSLHRKDCYFGQCGGDEICKRWRNWLIKELKQSEGK